MALTAGTVTITDANNCSIQNKQLLRNQI
jgi:hypothetical protein